MRLNINQDLEKQVDDLLKKGDYFGWEYYGYDTHHSQKRYFLSKFERNKRKSCDFSLSKFSIMVGDKYHNQHITKYHQRMSHSLSDFGMGVFNLWEYHTLLSRHSLMLDGVTIPQTLLLPNLDTFMFHTRYFDGIDPNGTYLHYNKQKEEIKSNFPKMRSIRTIDYYTYNRFSWVNNKSISIRFDDLSELPLLNAKYDKFFKLDKPIINKYYKKELVPYHEYKKRVSEIAPKPQYVETHYRFKQPTNNIDDSVLIESKGFTDNSFKQINKYTPTQIKCLISLLNESESMSITKIQKNWYDVAYEHTTNKKIKIFLNNQWIWFELESKIHQEIIKIKRKRHGKALRRTNK